MLTSQLKLLSRTQVFWSQCWDPKVCAHIPFDGDKCIGAHICVRIIEDNAAYFLEVEIDGHNARFALANGCIPTYTIGIAHLDVCVSPDVTAGHLSGVTLTIKVCVGADIGPIHLEKCWDLYKGTIHFALLASSELVALLGVEEKTLAVSEADKFIATSENIEVNYNSCDCK